MSERISFLMMGLMLRIGEGINFLMMGMGLMLDNERKN
jgi:hypothetical protein